MQSILGTLAAATADVTLTLAAIACYMLVTLLAVDVARATYRHSTRGAAAHPHPLPVHAAFLVGLAEVCWDKPVAFHRSRMAAVHRAEAHRLAAIEDTMLRHPANFGARQACMANHPAAQGTGRHAPLADVS